MLKPRGEDELIAYLSANMTLAPAGEDFMRILYQLARNVTTGVIVELGAYVGRSAIALAWDASVPVYSIDDYADHVDWSGRAYDAENEAAYQRNISAASVSTTLIKRDVQQAAQDWHNPIGLLIWDISESNRLFEDWRNWRSFIAVDGHALLRDTFDMRLGSAQVIMYESERHQFMIENSQPGLLTLRRYA